jgi:hypothetical protein
MTLTCGACTSITSLGRSYVPTVLSRVQRALWRNTPDSKNVLLKLAKHRLLKMSIATEFGNESYWLWDRTDIWREEIEIRLFRPLDPPVKVE